jgi:DNA-binding response OmpR family regulator
MWHAEGGGGARESDARMIPKKILICDDDDMLLDLLEFRLAARGFEVVAVRDGAAALQAVKTEKPDAIVLDTMMPVMDGNEVVRRLRADDGTREIPVIMLTARRQEKDIVGALELGANDYVVKPFIPEELITRLSRLVESRS